MAAINSRPLNPDEFGPTQLQMFMTGTELRGTINHSYDGSMRTGGDGSGPDGLNGLWKQKLKESKREGFGHGNGVYKSIKDHGWSADHAAAGYDIVNLYHNSKPGPIPEFDKLQRNVDDGHHRIAAAADLEAKGHGPYYIPVKNWGNDGLNPNA